MNNNNINNFIYHNNSMYVNSMNCNTNVSSISVLASKLKLAFILIAFMLPPATALTNLLVSPPSLIPTSASRTCNTKNIKSTFNHHETKKNTISSSSRRQHRNNKHILQMAPQYIGLFTKPDQNNEDTNTKRWLAWMTSGTNSTSSREGYGYDAVKMRDPVELGGLPRAERYASRDWLHNTINMPNSIILQNVRFPVSFMTIWGVCISLIHRMLKLNDGEHVLKRICIPTAPHSLMVSALGLLLVFRTNSAYQRFSEGRKIWEEILNIARDLSRMGKLYEAQLGSSKLRRMNRLLAAFPYLLRFRIRPNSIMKKIDDTEFTRDPENSLILYQDHAISDSDAEAAAVASDEETTGISRRRPRQLYWVDKRTLPWRLLPDKAMEECARAQNRPLWVCDRMAKELHSVPDSDKFTARERLALLSKVDKLSATIGACERIHQTVVPLNYARHALRCLTMWLFTLPFALVKDLGLMTGPTLFLISWMLFGVYEIGYSIEDPFQGTLRLSILCDAIRRDVLGDEIIRNTAFVLDSSDVKRESGSELDGDEESDDDDDLEFDEEEDISIEIEDIVIDEVGNFVNATAQSEINALGGYNLNLNNDGDSVEVFLRASVPNGSTTTLTKTKETEPSRYP